jgi:hypothetical protein
MYMNPVKALSLWQPYATLIALGAKRIETRSWSTSYRGPLVIQAASRWTGEQRDLCQIEPFASTLKSDAYTPPHHSLPLGAIVCVVDLAACRRTGQIRHTLSEQEQAFGNYADGRFAWVLENVRAFDEPYRLAGQRGLFDFVCPLCEGDGKVWSIGGAMEPCPVCSLIGVSQRRLL